MGQLGVGVMCEMLAGYGERAEVFGKALNKEIKSIELKDDRLLFKFTDDSGIQIWDSGQSCCEHRYMTIDDKLEDFFGSTLISGEIQPAPDAEDASEEHEIEFLVIKTSKGDLVVSSHNEHNGYYGGFSINVAKL